MNSSEMPLDYSKIAPSIFAGDFSRLSDSIILMKKKGIKFLHLDIMDGHFVPNISFGPKIAGDIIKNSDFIFDTHLMVSDPEAYIEPFKKAGTHYLTFHAEAVNKPETIIRKIREQGLKPGISIKPKTPVSDVIHLLPLIDLFLVMSVEPGFSGQKMLPSTLDKINLLKTIRTEKNLDFIIEADGGINFVNASELFTRGADLLVMGSAFFK